ncbi:unnamed protein product [[Candida] boidinii]|nr:unnamed protein product [[Candida] boidinii]
MDEDDVKEVVKVGRVIDVKVGFGFEVLVEESELVVLELELELVLEPEDVVDVADAVLLVLLVFKVGILFVVAAF